MVLADLDLGSRVPVFEVIEDRGIWLSFEPLKNLLGVYQRVGQAAGIAVHAGHPVPLQRFTAAHELGHHLLGHRSSFDNRDAIESQSDEPEEMQAQTFAASLLMSEATVESALEHRGLDPARPQLSPLDVYLMSSELGVSFKAAVTQLRVLNRIDPQDATDLYRQSALALKQQLLGGRRPDNPRASVWRLDVADNQRIVTVDLGDELDFALPEMRSTGYEWVPSPEHESHFAIVSDRYERADEGSDEPVFGASGVRHLTLKAVRAGTCRVNLVLEQPWTGGDSSATFTVSTTIASPPVSEVGRGISVNQQSQLLLAS
jgi:Zn-dependent peptidase ImmA (M78 family)/predicted secreted protein